jgi:hypothetical protein
MQAWQLAMKNDLHLPTLNAFHLPVKEQGALIVLSCTERIAREIRQ